MEVILLQRVENLGPMGAVVAVKPGYARNFLFPRKVALRATKENVAQFQAEKAKLEALNLKHKEEAQIVADKLEGLSVILLRQAGESGQLYGSVSAKDIAEAVTKARYAVDRKQVALESPIKTLGLHTAKVILHPEVSVPVIVNIALTQEEAETQLKKAQAQEA